MDNSYQQLEMFWPDESGLNLPDVNLAPGYSLRTYQPGDDDAFYQLMAQVGWMGWNQETLTPWRERLLPAGWVVIVHQASGALSASAMALRSDAFEGGGELGWLAASPLHYGRGLGMAAAVEATRIMLAAKLSPVHLYTEHWRLAAIKIYLKAGYQPFQNSQKMDDRWGKILAKLDWAE